jgi:two-component SAPR family response regulator
MVTMGCDSLTIIAVDVYKDKLNELEKTLRHVFPDDDIVTFADPLFAAKYGVRNKVDMVFTEILMGGLGGLTIASMIRERNRKARVVFVADADKFKDNARDAGYDDYLVRPVTAEMIAEINNKKTRRNNHGNQESINQ